MTRPARKKKLIYLLSIVIVAAIIVGLILYALRQNINLFFTPSQISAGQGVGLRAIRVGGMVVNNSIKHDKNNLLAVEFQLTDYQQTIDVSYQGILPDLFKAGQGVVALGQALDSHHFKAIQILAKHDENYMPPELRQMNVNKNQGQK